MFIPTPGPLHLLFFLFGMLFPKICSLHLFHHVGLWLVESHLVVPSDTHILILKTLHRDLADVIKNLGMRRLSWIISVGPR